MTSSIYYLSNSTLGRSTQFSRFIRTNQAEVDRASIELATGYRQDVAGDLGMRSSEAYEMRGQISKNESFILGNELSEKKMEFQSELIADIRSQVQGVLDLAVGNTLSPQGTASTLQLEASSAISRVLASLNATIDGDAIFSGINSETLPMTGYNDINPGTGLSPSGVVDGVTGGVILNAADAATKIAELQSIFDSSNLVVPARNYEDTFYNGTDLGVGQRRTAVIGDNDVIEYGVQANDPAFFEMYQGLAMLASVDVSTITDQAGYQAYMQEAVGKLSTGIDKLADIQAELGKDRQAVEEKIFRQQAQNDIYASKIAELETVDPYEAASRLSAFEFQLEATYASTARLSQLTFLNYFR